MPRKSQKDKDQEIIDEAIKRFDRWTEADRENRELALEDIKFVDDEDAQWTEDAKNKRQDRPCMTFDKTSGPVDQVVGDMLQNRPGIKIRASEDGDTEIADIYTGIIRAIENTSKAKRAYGTAFKFAVKGGYGVWRVRHDWVDHESFSQDLLIEPVQNPFSVVFDTDAKETTKEDGKGAFVFEDMFIEDFEETWPKAKSRGGSFEGYSGNDWVSKDTIRVAEYYRKVPKTKTIYLLNTGQVVDADDFDEELWAAEGIEIVNERESDGYEIEYYKLTAYEILEKLEYKGKFIPLIPVYGRVTNIAGKFKYRGIVRKAKDPQRAFNYELSNHIELGALQPKAPYMATPAMVKGQEKQWKRINVSNDPILLFNPDPQFPGGKPFREPPPQASNAMLSNISLMADNIKSATGIFDASLGDRSNETSGVAIQSRDRQGDTATYEFTDELVESITYSGRILVDMIPKVYDTRRQLRILGEDESEDVIEVNKPVRNFQTGEFETINDLSRGKYDVAVSAGASYSTKRVETAEQLGQIMAQNPQMASLIGDIWVKSLDLVDSEEVIKRLRRIGIKQGFIEPNEEEMEEMRPQMEQNQQLQQAAQQLEQRVKQAEAAKEEADAVKTQAEARTEETEALLNTVEARLKQAELAQQQGDVQSMMAQLQLLRQALSPQRAA